MKKRKNKAMTAVEVLIATLIFSIFVLMLHQVFYGGKKAFVKTMDSQTLNEVAQRIIANLKHDIQSSNLVLAPSLDGGTSEVLLLVRQVPDYTADPAEATGFDGTVQKTARVNYKSQLIKYTVVEDPSSQWALKMLVKSTKDVGSSDDTHEVEVANFSSADSSMSTPGRIEHLWFSRDSFKTSSLHPSSGKAIGIPPEPRNNGGGAGVIRVNLRLKNPSEELGDDGGYTIDLDFALQLRGGAL